jgi:hypothetical protein
MRYSPRPRRAIAIGVGALVVAAVLWGGAAASAVPAGSAVPGPAGPPVSAAEAATLHALSCGGTIDSDTQIANAVRSQMNGPRLGSAITAYNVSCARAIVAAVHGEGLDERAATIALTTAITESSLNNWDGGDADSVGLFQQRPSAGWGTVAQLENPTYATDAFLNAMKSKYPNNSWESGDIGAICQAVQVSAYPDAYDQEVHDATLLAGQLWSSPPPATPERIGVLTTNLQALAKEGGLSAAWVHEDDAIQQVVVSGDRVGVLTTDGVAYVKEGGLSAAWVHEYTGVQQLALSGDRIGVLTTDGIVYVKEGSPSAAWTHEYTGVQQLALSGDRVGVLTTAGAALVKDGGLSAAWDTEYSGVQQLALSGNRIGILTTGGAAFVKDGDLGAAWVHEDDGVQQLVLAGDRIGILTTGAVAYVKDGGLSASWVHENDNVQQLALAANRIGILTIAGVAYVKDGDLGASWVHEDDGIRQIALS